MAYITLLLLILQLGFKLVGAAGSQVSLLSFGSPPAGISAGCKVQYAATIPSCSTDDFQPGAACSNACESALLQVQSEIDAACGGSGVDSKTLLGRIFQGDIIGALCPTPSSASTAGAATTSSEAVIVKSSAPKMTTSTVSSSVLVAVSSAPPLTSSALTSGISAVATVEASSSSALIEIATSTVAVETSSTTSPASQQSSPTRKLTMQEQQIAAEADTGGGSPFDIISTSSASHPVGKLAAILIALACTVYLLGR